MKRIKKVFSSHSEVAHIWAQQKQESGRASRMFFEGPTIYSYGKHFPIATFITPEIVLVNCARYSSSTGKHQSYVRSAVSHKQIFDVPSLCGQWAESGPDHDANLKYFLAQAAAERAKALKALTAGEYHRNQCEGIIADARRYAQMLGPKAGLRDTRAQVFKLFKQIISSKYWTAAELATIAKCKARAAAMEAKKAARREIEEAARAVEQKESMEKWLCGEDIRSYFYGPTRLRIKDKRIETSRGAQITLRAALDLWAKLRAGQDVTGLELDTNYTVNSWDGTILTVGCHQIARAELESIAKVLGLEPLTA